MGFGSFDRRVLANLEAWELGIGDAILGIMIHFRRPKSW